MTALDKIKKIEESLNNYYYERNDAIRAISIGMLSNLNVILVGPPGTAKTDISKSWTDHIKSASYFGVTLNPFTTPDEVFGTFDIPKLKTDGIMMRKTEGYLPSANVVAIEEIFKAGKGTLNSLIEVSHPSRLFSNGPERNQTPILTIIGTSNELPVGEQDLSAIYDRMIVKIYVRGIEDKENFGAMINNQSDFEVTKSSMVSLTEIFKARKEVSNVEMGEGVLSRLIVLRQELSKAGVYPSDRTFKLCIKALKANAYLEGRKEVTDDDILFLRHILWYDPDEESTVWRAIIQMVKPELKRLAEIHESVQSATTEALKNDNTAEMASIYKKIRSYMNEAKKIRNDMVKKKRMVDECDQIIRKLKGHAKKISDRLIGEDPDNGEDFF